LKTLLIKVDFADETDLDYLRAKLVGVVEDEVDIMKEEERNDGAIEVSWDIEEVE
jgi:hypothetical protein